LSLNTQGFAQQKTQLANQYYNSGEYEKAAKYFKEIFEKTNRNPYYFNKYIECLLALDQYKESEKAIKDQLKRNRKDVHLYVLLGNVHDRKIEPEKAKIQYERAIQELPAEYNQISSLANAYIRQTKYDLALRTYEKGEKLLQEEGRFAYYIADIHKRKGDTPKMIHHYLLSAKQNPGRVESLKKIFINSLGSEDYVELMTQLYDKMQDDPENIFYPEMLEWIFIQQKDYVKALRQAKALDLRLEENGNRVYNIGSIAANDKDYDTAIKAYEFIIETKGINSSYYIDARQELLSNKKKKVLYNKQATDEDFLYLKEEYLSYLDELGWNAQSAYIVSELASLSAYYLKDLEEGISILEKMINYPGVNKYVRANGKINLGDFYLMKGDIWEATLLYSQVDKEFKEDFLGEKARFKNAKLFYYNGDFQWSQKQFDVLKASTSKLISNDAIDISVFIMDNLGLDTTDVALGLYAESELLIVQNKFDQAFEKLDTLVSQFPDHTLQDDIYYAKAHIYKKQRNYDQAVVMYNKIIENYPEEIRCDNSIYELAEMYETEIGDIEKASALYEKLFIDFTNSTLAIEARKKYRQLRGDLVQ